MTAAAELSTSERVYQLFQHLGIRQAHIAGSMREVLDLHDAYPDAVASLTMVCPFATPTPDQLRPLGAGVLFIHGDRGPQAGRVPNLLPGLPDAQAVVLDEFVDIAWADPCAERGESVSEAMLAFLAAATRETPLVPTGFGDDEGEVAGISYRATGDGPPLMLFPLMLAPSQWEPLRAVLGQRYRVIVLGGAYIGPVAMLAQRARVGFGRVVRSFIDEIAPRPDERMLDVGCGSGETIRMLARHTGAVHPIVGMDLNPYLLREAASISRAEGLADRMTFREGNAEALPFDDASFDVTVSFTVIEEVNADRMFAEMLRVTQPGGRIGVLVRAVDMPHWHNLSLFPELRTILAGMGAGVSEGGCADASLYRRFVAAGLTGLTMGPKFGTNHTGPGFAEVKAGFVAGPRGRLSGDDLAAWDAAVAQAEADGTLMWAQVFHCAVGTKP